MNFFIFENLFCYRLRYREQTDSTDRDGLHPIMSRLKDSSIFPSPDPGLSTCGDCGPEEYDGFIRGRPFKGEFDGLHGVLLSSLLSDFDTVCGRGY